MKLSFIPLTLLLLVLSACENGFIPIDPQTKELQAKVEESEYMNSIGYEYLLKNYNNNSKQDSVSYLSEDAEHPCGFYQVFNKDIHYKINQCEEEGGFNEYYSFPKTDRAVMKAFIEKLFYEEDNTWIDEDTYGPDGAGCYYTIVEKSKRTEIEVYCGC